MSHLTDLAQRVLANPVNGGLHSLNALDFLGCLHTTCEMRPETVNAADLKEALELLFPSLKAPRE